MKSWVIITIIIIVIGNFYINKANNIIEYTSGFKDTFTQFITLYGNNQFVPVILDTAIFELFRRIKISNSKFINVIGTSAFMIYLIHGNIFAYEIWKLKD